ncbi:NADPH-dependent diflavin oxidoreductase 1 isoform X2 [Dermacentor silvarum]|uniref:NADPH-dependent diflavin oxidoreductase 1 isoform X2 n=1 Tax=Dermacentor silvarum TaxID=543639 RepID=UPI0021012DD2|nr:NADPH-dependent diflavin oxidoreductase 1 isoform X2 [Dermacentor silvarum]
MMDRRFLILYGSQTGTAQDVAERIGRQARRYRFCVTVSAMDDYSVAELIKEKCVLFVCATTGQGEEPDNMKRFWSFLLRKSLPLNSLKTMNQSVIGLGDSSYLKFNFTAKRLHRRLAQLGANCLLDPLYADEQHELGTDGMLDPWLGEFWKIILSLHPLPAGCLPISEELLPAPKYGVICDMAYADGPGIIYEKFFEATVVSNQRVTSLDHFQDVRLIKLDIQDSQITFEPGDVVVIYPENCEEDIKEFFRLFSFKADMHLKVTPTEEGTPLPNLLSAQVAIRECAQKYFDLTYIPKRGLCTRFLASLDPSKGTRVAITTKKGSLRMPPDGVPAIMVGPGTGCAPFCSMIQDRAQRGIARNLLFFGARNAKGDFFFEKEWTKLVAMGLLDLVTAFSRDQGHKIYVQHRIKEHEGKIWKLLCNGGVVYIAGNAKDMVPSVRDALKAVVKSGSLTDENAEELLKNLEKSKRLQIEAWS